MAENAISIPEAAQSNILDPIDREDGFSFVLDCLASGLLEFTNKRLAVLPIDAKLKLSQFFVL